MQATVERLAEDFSKTRQEVKALGSIIEARRISDGVAVRGEPNNGGNRLIGAALDSAAATVPGMGRHTGQQPGNDPLPVESCDRPPQ